MGPSSEGSYLASRDTRLLIRFWVGTLGNVIGGFVAAAGGSAVATYYQNRQIDYVQTEPVVGGDSIVYRVRVAIDSTHSRVRYLMLSPHHEIQIFGVGGTYNPAIINSECRIFDRENFACANFNVLYGKTVARLEMTDGLLTESGVDGMERVYSRRVGMPAASTSAQR